MATYAITTANSSLVFDTASSGYNSCYQIDSNHYINFFQGASTDGFVQVFTVNTSTWAVTTANSALEFDTVQAIFNSCYPIDSNHFVNFWAGSGNDGFVQVFTINTSTWQVTTANDRLEYNGTNSTFNSCFKIDANHFINFYSGNGSYGTAQVFTVNTSTWTVTTNGEKVFYTQALVYHSCSQIDANHFINFWHYNYYVRAQVFTVNTSTWAVTTANEDKAIGIGGYYNSCFKIDSNHFILFTGVNGGKNGYAQVLTVNTSTWAITTANNALTFDTYTVEHNSCFQIDSNHFVNFWKSGNGGDGYVQTFTVNTSTWEVTTSNSSLEFDTQDNNYNSCYQIDYGHFINFWSGKDRANFVQVFTVELPVSSNIKTYNTNVRANIKTINTNPIANVKSLNTNV